MMTTANSHYFFFNPNRRTRDYNSSQQMYETAKTQIVGVKVFEGEKSE